MTKKKTVAVIQWSAPIIDIGFHYCEEPRSEKLLDVLWVKTGEVSKFWYAYDLTSYHVSSGETPLKAIDGLLHTLWGGEVLDKEFRAKGKVIRNRLHREHPEALKEFRAAMRKWKGTTIKGVDWRRWLTPAQKEVTKLKRVSK